MCGEGAVGGQRDVRDQNKVCERERENIPEREEGVKEKGSKVRRGNTEEDFYD